MKQLDLNNITNKIYKNQKIILTNLENFIFEIEKFIKSIDSKSSEEHLKYPLRDFLKNTFYQKNEINTKGNIDFTINLNNSQNKNLGVIIETKAPNSNEMITRNNLQAKSMYQCLLYYLQERITNQNNDLKHIIITNFYEWFVFDANNFEQLFYNNGKKALVKEFINWEKGKKTSKKTSLFYKEIAPKYIEEISQSIQFLYFNLKNLDIDLKLNKIKILALYKIFSSEFLLKKSFANDSNTLDKEFYFELLYIIGLEEKTEKGKTVIKRKQKKQHASLIENTISIVNSEERLDMLENPEQYGANNEEQIEIIALELNILWINRIIFLKLLEAQLINYHNNNSDFKFLNYETIQDFDELNELFFRIIAKKTNERPYYLKQKFAKIPYLNSSLFEISKLEKQIIRINSLKSRIELPLFNKTVLKNGQKTLPILQYIFKFLDAFDFTSANRGEIQKEQKNLINASVLGLVFEKINGYKDGSFFTPGYITTSISRETIRQTVVNKFIEAGFKNINNFENIKRVITNIEDANKIVNSIKICDPAVGSGHFLVSALNELLTIKSELGILQYKNGNPIINYKAEIENDELIIINKFTEEIFEYNLSKQANIIDYKQDLQEAIFYEKETIIENCLFGVDINPNSVNICRLRLWIELLKHSYYKQSNLGLELQTLPNIDINIKEGNSLVSKFALRNGYSSIPNGQIKKMVIATRKYKEQVVIYKSTSDKTTKKNCEKEIEKLKNQFIRFVNPKDKDYLVLRNMKVKLMEIQSQNPMLMTKEDRKTWKHNLNILPSKINELEKEFEQKQINIYEKAFEWRFEFPEVLDKNGNFQGFDIVLGNPPYITLLLGKKQENKNLWITNYYKQNYQLFEYKGNTYTLFIEKANEILNKNGIFSYIVPSTVLLGNTYSKTRKFLLENNLYQLINFSEEIFEQANIGGVSIFFANKNNKNKQIEYTDINNISKFNENKYNTQIIQKKHVMSSYLNKFYSNSNIFSILKKIESKNTEKLENIVKSYQGIITGNNKKFLSIKKTNYRHKKIVRGKDIQKYIFSFNKNYILFKPKELWSNTNTDYFYRDEKLISRQTSDKLIACYDNSKILTLDSTHIHVLINENYFLKYVLALFNSKLLNFYYQSYVNEGKRVFAQVKIVIIKTLPIKMISKTEQQVFVNKVDEIIKIKNKNSTTDITKIQNEIDQLVYKLYNITENEIKIINPK